MRDWLRQVSAQWTGGLLVVITLAVFGGASAIAFWAYRTLSGPAFATIALCLAVAALCAACAVLWLRGRLTGDVKGCNDAEVRALTRERDAIAQENDRLQRQVRTQKVQIDSRDGRIGSMEPLVQWAQHLIDRERDTKMYLWLVPEQVAVTNASHLNDPEPYFEIVVPFRYNGTGHIVVGQTCSGCLSWDGREFAREPKITSGLDAPLPLEADGPTSGEIRVRQYVSNDLRDRIKTFVEQKPPEMEFWIRGFHISLRIEAFDGRVLYSGELLSGDYLAAQLRYG